MVGSAVATMVWSRAARNIVSIRLVRMVRTSLGVSGARGVAANSLLRRRTEEACGEAGIGAFLPSRSLCTDNAAMVAAAGWWRLHHGDASDLSLGADPTLRLAAAT